MATRQDKPLSIGAGDPPSLILGLSSEQYLPTPTITTVPHPEGSTFEGGRRDGATVDGEWGSEALAH